MQELKDGTQPDLWTMADEPEEMDCDQEHQELRSGKQILQQEGKAPEIWKLTWEQCLEVYECGGSLVSWQGHLLAGNDRKIKSDKDWAHVKQAYQAAQESARRSGKNIEEHIH